MKNVFLILLVALALPMAAQRRSRNLNAPPEVVDPPRTGHGIGAVFSSTNGNGLAYRYWPGKVGVHLSCFPLVTNSNSMFSFGTTFYRTIKEYHGTNKFFFQVGMDYMHNTHEVGYFNSETYTSDSFNFGFGPGFETHSRYGSFSAYLGYGLYNTVYSGVNTDKNLFTFSGGVSYFFEI